MDVIHKYHSIAVSLFIAVLSCFFGACSSDSDYKQVDFSKTVQSASRTVQEAGHPSLRVAIAAMISPKESISKYKSLMDYIGKKMGYQIILIQRKTYGEINELFQKQQIDLALICSGPYANGKDIFQVEALAVPLVRGEHYYRSYLIVNKKSSIKTLEDLRGKTFAYTDPDSNTGTLVPNYWVAMKGETSQLFFKETTYTYSHDNSIIAVAKSLVDGAAVDSHIWEYYHRTNPEYTANTRIIKKSIPFGSPPFVSSRSLPLVLKENVKEILLTMHLDPEGKQIQDSLFVDKFVLPQESWYQPIIKMKQEFEQLKKKRANGTGKP
ncbi:MAG: phosphate/phosphite/phosphonate ABC transporter substrate-binding protein [Proteobacteria bacterium]|nr:phosphate/phosphite/phosphonate ABC transporter substrate-binding protein [Pseudomonadota bacterium]MBU1698150.1 phosphate/phosphite/phosphonate ABC transporter substrate-binding protein [Pseudomonadota bacterium]